MEQQQETDQTINKTNIVGEILLPENMEGVLIVWFYLNNEMAIPGELKNCVILYSDQQTCIDYIASNKTNIIFLITSNSSAISILPAIHDMRQLDCIFIYTDEQNDKGEILLEKYSKIIENFSQADLLLESIKANIKLAVQQSESFKFYDQHQKSTRDLSNESGTFLWLKIFRDIFVEIPLDKNAKADMIYKLKECYRNNNKQLKLIEEFNRNYKEEDALRWYTGQPFIYKQINRALRTEDIEQLHKFRYFIAGLCSCIMKEHQHIKELVDDIKLYRGFVMSAAEFEQFKNHVGKIVSINGFLSTSRSKDVAKMFAGKPLDNKRSLLFEIECDVDHLQDAIVFADIARFSKHSDELEVLFDLGPTFEILCVDEYEPDCWLVKLKAVDMGDKISKEYLQTNRKEFDGESSALAYASLLSQLGYLQKALHFYEERLMNSTDEDEARVRFGIGTVYFSMRDFDKAIENLTYAYKLMINADPQRVEESTIVLNSLGNVYTTRGEYDKAIIHFTEALVSRKRLFNDEVFNIDADIMSNIATVYFLEGEDYDLALHYYKRALNIQRTCYSLNHEIIAGALHNIGNCYLKKQDYVEAFKYFHDCLTMTKEIFPAEHVKLAGILSNLGCAYRDTGKMDESLRYFTESLKMYENIFPKGHPDTSICLTNIGHFHHINSNYNEALEYFQKAFDMNDVFLPVLHNDIAGNLINIARALTDQGKAEEALIYRILSLMIKERLYPNGHDTMIANLNEITETYFNQGEYYLAIAYSLKTIIVTKWFYKGQADSASIANILFNIGMAFMMIGKIDLSLTYHLRALQRRNKIFPNGHASVCSSLAHTANMYHLKKQYELALQYYEKALMIYQNIFPDTYQNNHSVGEIFPRLEGGSYEKK